MDASGNCRLCTEFNFEMLGLESSCCMDSNADLTVNVKLKIDDFIHFVVDAYTAHLIVAIRSKWQVTHSYFNKLFDQMLERQVFFLFIFDAVVE